MPSTVSKLIHAEDVFRPLYEDHDYFLNPSTVNRLRDLPTENTFQARKCKTNIQDYSIFSSSSQDKKFYTTSSGTRNFLTFKTNAEDDQHPPFKWELNVQQGPEKEKNTKHSFKSRKYNKTNYTNKTFVNRGHLAAKRIENCAYVKIHGLSDLRFLQENVKRLGTNPLKKFYHTIFNLRNCYKLNKRNRCGSLTFRGEHYNASVSIAKSWKSYVCRSVFLYLRDLLYCFREVSPAILLRSMNPAEANLMDEPATGMHIHFRLGGVSFPPLIMYKIYTNCPVVSISDVVMRRKNKEPPCYTFPGKSDDHVDDNNNWRPLNDNYSKFDENKPHKNVQSGSGVSRSFIYSWTNSISTSRERSFIKTKPPSRPSELCDYFPNDSILQFEDELMQWAKNL